MSTVKIVVMAAHDAKISSETFLQKFKHLQNLRNMYIGNGQKKLSQVQP
jgi:purine-nucleoside phosphorylase